MQKYTTFLGGVVIRLPRASASAQACVSGMFELKEDSAFKQHLRDFLVQTKSFADKNNADLFAEEAAAQREVRGRWYNDILLLDGCLV